MGGSQTDILTVEASVLVSFKGAYECCTHNNMLLTVCSILIKTSLYRIPQFRYRIPCRNYQSSEGNVSIQDCHDNDEVKIIAAKI